jgi:death-on-curing protein
VQFLSLDDILESHQFQIDSYGGSPGIREIGLLESAIAQPQASLGGSFCTQTFTKWPRPTFTIW